jgi:ribosome recycling factor
MDKEQLVHVADDLMKKSIDKFSHELSMLRTSRATPALLDGIKVECYNTLMPISQVAGISIRDAKTIEIKPWDAAVLGLIEKAIQKSSLGINPVNDGKLIRLSLPPLTEDRRKDLVKQCHKIAEEFRVSIRNERRLAVENVKKHEKDKLITEDDRFKLEAGLQKLTDSYIKKVDEILSAKEKEIMQV